MFTFAQNGCSLSSEYAHVVPNGNHGWKVIKNAANRASGSYKTKKEAVDAGRKMSQNQKTELVIHGKDGKIQNKDSHGNDQYPPKG